jgi:hypothetical protein
LKGEIDEDVVMEDIGGGSQEIGIEKDVLGAILPQVEIDCPIDCFEELSRRVRNP